MKIMDAILVRRWNSVMNSICLEHLTIGETLSELENDKHYYDIEDGITIGWMLKEAEYHLSCYYESGHLRCDMKHDKEEGGYNLWLSETKKLQRLISRLKQRENDFVVVEWM